MAPRRWCGYEGVGNAAHLIRKTERVGGWRRSSTQIVSARASATRAGGGENGSSPETHPGLVASGVVLPEESLLKYVFSDGCEKSSSGAAVVTMRGTAAEEESGKGESVESGLAGTRLDLKRTKRLGQYCGHHGRRHESVVAPLRKMPGKCYARTIRRVLVGVVVDRVGSSS
jgi:hypothetical protein